MAVHYFEKDDFHNLKQELSAFVSVLSRKALKNQYMNI